VGDFEVPTGGGICPPIGDQTYSSNIIRSEYQPGFKATLGLKDLRLAREAATAAARVLPMLDAVHYRMRDAVDAGFGDRDWSAIAKFTIDHG
jgi:3-hydroxyisobutyrate dehydrogenase-like beta-hydroxyacid dehydrogenase